MSAMVVVPSQRPGCTISPLPVAAATLALTSAPLALVAVTVGPPGLQAASGRAITERQMVRRMLVPSVGIMRPSGPAVAGWELPSPDRAPWQCKITCHGRAE